VRAHVHLRIQGRSRSSSGGNLKEITRKRDLPGDGKEMDFIYNLEF